LTIKCHFGDGTAAFRCARTGEYLCAGHARLDIVSVSTRATTSALPVRAAQAVDYATIKEMALAYWGETEVLCFDRTYDVLALPALLATDDGEVAGALSYSLEGDRLNIVLLNVHPQWQGKRVARSLLAVVEEEARARGMSRLVVATSNDDLPALYLYQRLGFVLTRIKIGAILAHHGREERGFAGIPVRDEIRLEKRLAA